MRLGLFVIDSLDEHLHQYGGDYPERFARLFGGAGADVDFYDGRGDQLPDPATHDGWVIPGSRQSVYEDLDWIRRLEAWIVGAVAQRVPLIGICFGHQLIARALGGRVEKAAGGWNIGAIDYDVAGAPDWLTAPERLRLLASHQDQVVALPPGAEVLATAPGCAIAAYTIGDHVICVQAHPEFEPELVAPLFEGRRERLGDAAVDDALASLDQPLDNKRTARLLTSIVRSQAERGGGTFAP